MDIVNSAPRRSFLLLLAAFMAFSLLAALRSIALAEPPGGPEAVDDIYEAELDQRLLIDAPGVLENDEPDEGLTARVVNEPSGGDLILEDDGGFVFTSTLENPGVVTFTYEARDANGPPSASDQATVTITVKAPENERPIASDDYYETERNQPLVIDAPGVLENDDDPDGDELTAEVAEEPLEGELDLYEEGGLVYTPSVDYTGVVTFTYRAMADKGAGSHPATVTITVTEEARWDIHLPLVTKPLPGDISFSSRRFAGITTFIPEIDVGFEDIFSENPPDGLQMQVWRDDQPEPSDDDWGPYSSSHPMRLKHDVIGAQLIHARFRIGGVELPQKTGVVFYIPNGDFTSVGLEEGWKIVESDLPVDIDGGNLILGNPDLGCTNVPDSGLAAASLELNIPAGSDYKLRVGGTIYTYDKLPSPESAEYDAFEIHVGSDIHRYGNDQAPLSCATLWEVPLDETLSLSGHEGITAVSLENHTRFDNYYNTYTYVGQIWVEE